MTASLVSGCRKIRHDPIRLSKVVVVFFYLDDVITLRSGGAGSRKTQSRFSAAGENWAKWEFPIRPKLVPRKEPSG